MKISPVKKIATVLGAGSLLLGGLAMAPSATAATPATTAPAAAPAAVSPDAGTRTSIVAAWYQQFLGHSPDAGSQYWVARLRTQSDDSVLTDLLRTREAATKTVNDLYTTFLGRGIAGDRGAATWVDGIVGGAFPAEWAEQNILASPEFIARRTAANADSYQTIRAWYRDILGRTPRDGEVDYWANQLSRSSALGVVREIWYTPEAVSLRVASHYRDYLQRSANSGETAFWAPAEVRGDIGVVIAIASSAEYRQNSPTFVS